MGMVHKWVLIASIIGETMYRAHHYGYDKGVWSWIIIVTFVTPFVLGLWRMMAVATGVYALFYISFYDHWGGLAAKPLIQYFMIVWIGIFIIWMMRNRRVFGPTFKRGACFV